MAITMNPESTPFHCTHDRNAVNIDSKSPNRTSTTSVGFCNKYSTFCAVHFVKEINRELCIIAQAYHGVLDFLA